MMLPLLLLACHGGEERARVSAPPPAERRPEQGKALRFHTLAAPPVDGLQASARRGDQRLDIGWYPLLREGEGYGGPPFGTILDGQGQPIPLKSEHPSCASPDFNGLIQASGRTWLLTHLECSPAALQRSLLERVPDGAFRVLESVPAPITPPEGLNNLCAGQITPWRSLLSGEEYETNVALVENGRVLRQAPGKSDGKDFVDTSDLVGVSRYAGGSPSPYRWGWMVETWIQDGEGNTENTKRYAMGRFSHELGLVMPDNRTVYMSDDNSHAILAMFVADQPANLSAGTLYAARWERASAPETEGYTLSWVSLGHATDDQIRGALVATRFDDLYTHTVPENGTCPEGFTIHRSPQSVDECLQVVPGKEMLASRLETRRAAGLAGATTELHKAEGMALDPDGRRLFAATTRIGAGMLAEDPPFPGRDHIAEDANGCGVIWSLNLGEGATDTSGAPIDSAWVAGGARAILKGEPDESGCKVGTISGPDNLAWIPGDLKVGQDGVLLIAEDSGRAPNLLWAWQDQALVPVFAAPVGESGKSQEVSGLSWNPSLDGAGWITISLQHGDDPATVGLIGPF